MLHDCLCNSSVLVVVTTGTVCCLGPPPAPVLGCRGMNADHPRQSSASIAQTVPENRKKKTVRIVTAYVDVRFYQTDDDLDGDGLCIDESATMDNKKDNTRSHIDTGDVLIIPDLGDELVIDHRMPDVGKQMCMGDTFIADHALHSDRLEMHPVHPTTTCHPQSSMHMGMRNSHEHQAGDPKHSMSAMQQTTIINHQTSTTMQSDVGVETESVIKFKKLANQLGGLSFDYNTYRATFGDITDERPYGTHVWRGMMQKAVDYPLKQKVWGIHPWFCYFITPEKFSKSTAANPVSTLVNRGTDFNTDNSYPAIVFLTDAQHSYLMSMAACCRHTKNISDSDFFDGLQFDGRSVIDSSAIVRASPGISTVVRYDPMVISEVDMCCLKILIIGCRPWRVHSSWLQLYMPVAYAKL